MEDKFDIELVKKGYAVMTVNGKPVRVLCTDSNYRVGNLKKPIWVIINPEDPGSVPCSFAIDGFRRTGDATSNLVMVPRGHKLWAEPNIDDLNTRIVLRECEPMQKRPFDLEAAKRGEPFTFDGWPVDRVLDWNLKSVDGEAMVLVIIDMYGREQLMLCDPMNEKLATAPKPPKYLAVIKSSEGTCVVLPKLYETPDPGLVTRSEYDGVETIYNVYDANSGHVIFFGGELLGVYPIHI